MLYDLKDNQILDKLAQASEILTDGDRGEVLIPESSVRDLTYVDLSGSAYHSVKRALDFLIAFCGMCFLAIPFLMVAAVIYLDDPGTVFFRQNRIGQDGKVFCLYKFRSMRMDTPEYLPTNELTDPEAHITRFGHFLRKTSLDELPQLINVILGDMSLVGPRPLIAEEEEIHRMRTRFGVYKIRPGITGLAQINGRDTVSAVNKVRMDVAYLQRFSFLTDLKILLSTIPKLSGDKFVMEGYNANDPNSGNSD